MDSTNKPVPGNRKLNIWPQDVRDRALEIYLNQEYPNYVEISEDTGVPVDTLKVWRTKDNWVEKRRLLLETASDAKFFALLAESISTKRQILSDFQKMRDVAVTAVEDEDLKFRDKKQAIDALNMAVRGEAEMLEKSVPLILLQEVAQIILDEVEDEETRSRIGQRIASLGSVWAARGVSS